MECTNTLVYERTNTIPPSTSPSSPMDMFSQSTDLHARLFHMLWRTGVTRCDSTNTHCAIPSHYWQKYTVTQLMEKAGIKSIVGKSHRFQSPISYNALTISYYRLHSN